jgi:Holliday junction resolvase-like predicted endonuclease
MKTIKKIIGKFYENKAITFLKNKKYIFIDKNIYIGHKEIDILCIDKNNNENVIVEVKYKNIFLKDLSCFINLYNKKKFLSEIINSQILETKYNLQGFWRIDCVFFCNDGVEHLINI